MPDVSDELSSRRTSMSFQRTRMSADRTLMSVIRTSLSLIGFGFTIYQVFQNAYEAGLLKGSRPARNFGEALVLLGMLMLGLGIVYHVQFMIGLRRLRASLITQTLVHGEDRFPVSLTLLVALTLFAVGVVAIISMVFQAGPFS